MSRKSLATLIALIAIVIACGVYRNHSDTAVTAPAGAIPEPGHGLPGILDFGQGTCLPCQQMMPVLEERPAFSPWTVARRTACAGSSSGRRSESSPTSA
jgi:hypothetical protein